MTANIELNMDFNRPVQSLHADQCGQDSPADGVSRVHLERCAPEHGRYPAGSWLRSPHLSQHFPYVEDETIILVKTGHLNNPASDNNP